MNRPWKLRVAICAVLSALVACVDSSDIVFSDFVSMEGDGLPSSTLYMFPVGASDSISYPSEPADVVLVIRFDNGTSLDTLPLKVIEFNGTTLDSDTISVSMNLQAGKNGIATGSYGLHEVCDTLKSGVRLPSGYSVGILSELAGDVSGIRTLGVVVTKSPSR